jgi:hypothetical protein
MSEAMVRAEGLRNVKHQYDVDAEHPRLVVSWEDNEGSHSLTLEHAVALSAGYVLYAQRGDQARTEYLKKLICEERL